jgi:hypothetical protein
MVVHVDSKRHIEWLRLPWHDPQRIARKAFEEHPLGEIHPDTN